MDACFEDALARTPMPGFIVLSPTPSEATSRFHVARDDVGRSSPARRPAAPRRRDDPSARSWLHSFEPLIAACSLRRRGPPPPRGDLERGRPPADRVTRASERPRRLRQHVARLVVEWGCGPCRPAAASPAWGRLLERTHPRAIGEGSQPLLPGARSCFCCRSPHRARARPRRARAFTSGRRGRPVARPAPWPVRLLHAPIRHRRLRLRQKAARADLTRSWTTSA